VTRTEPSTRRGVTLVELLVVLAIIGAMLGVVAPALSALASAPETPDRAMDRVLESARATALNQAVDVEVIVNARRDRAWVRSDAARPRLDTAIVFEGGFSNSLAAPTPISGRRTRYLFRANGTAWSDSLLP
jgi:prepilin-type N-terminal cleavage/methylation domain-containing protein